MTWVPLPGPAPNKITKSKHLVFDIGNVSKKPSRQRTTSPVSGPQPPWASTVHDTPKLQTLGPERSWACSGNSILGVLNFTHWLITVGL